jgi:hypothetical protein
MTNEELKIRVAKLEEALKAHSLEIAYLYQFFCLMKQFRKNSCLK